VRLKVVCLEQALEQVYPVVYQDLALVLAAGLKVVEGKDLRLVQKLVPGQRLGHLARLRYRQVLLVLSQKLN
jgi:hypothetical protein